MSKNPFWNATAALLVATVMVLPTLLSMDVAADTLPYVSDDQQVEIESRLGLGAPFGDWDQKVETSRLYMHWRESTSPAGTVPSGPAGDAGMAETHMDFRAPPLCPPGNPAGSADCPKTLSVGPYRHQNYPLPAPGGCQTVRHDTLNQAAYIYATPTEARANTTIYEVAVNLYVPEGSRDFNTFSLQLLMGNTFNNEEVCFDDRTFGFDTQRRGPISTNAGQTYLVSGTQSFGFDGKLLPKDHFLILRITGNGDPFLLDSPITPSFVEIRADTPRLNLWTENRHGEPTNDFPAGIASGTEDRRIAFRALVANSFGIEDCPAMEVAGRHDPNMVNMTLGNHICPTDNFHENNVRFRVRDRTPEHNPTDTPGWDRPWRYNEYVPVDQGLGLKEDPGRDDLLIRCCNLDVEPIRYNDAEFDLDFQNSHSVVLLEHEFVYGTDFPAGVYEIEFHDIVRGWKVLEPVHIGNTGFTFEFAPGEAEISEDGSTASHRVAMGEPTEYVVRVTNGGAASDTFSVSVPTPQTPGLRATVQPNSAQIPSGSHVDFTVTVVPPAQGIKPGDIKVASIEAVSLRDNTVKTLFTRTTYTAEELHGIDISTERLIVETRPERVESFGVLLRNTGTVQDDFVLTARGIPEGWTVDMLPSYSHVYAASREDILVQVYAPAEALPPPDPITDCADDPFGDPPRVAHPGCDWTLTIQGRRATDTTVQDLIEIPVRIFLIDKIDAVPIVEEPWYATISDETGGAFIRARDVANSRYTCPSSGACTRDNRVETHADVHFDDAVLFRVRVDNLGDRNDEISMFASWDPNVGEDQANCMFDPNPSPVDDYDGVPDMWHFRVLTDDISDPMGRFQTQSLSSFPTAADGSLAPQNRGAAARTGPVSNPFAGEYTLGTLGLPPRTSQYVWIEMKWEDAAEMETGDELNPLLNLMEGACPDSDSDNFRHDQPSPEARLRVTFRSGNDPALRVVKDLDVQLQDESGTTVDLSGGVPVERIKPDVQVHMHLDAPPSGIVAQPTRSLREPATYKVNVVNTGNQHDDITVRVDRGLHGWEHNITDVAYIPSTITAEPERFSRTPSMNGSVGKQRQVMNNPMPPNCSFEQIGGFNLQLRCVGVGVHDEIVLTVETIPPSFESPLAARIGDVDDLPITATASGGGLKKATDDIVIQTRVQGDYFFELESHAGQRDAYPGQTFAFPFTIRNMGTERDRYRVDIVEAAPQVDGTSSIEESWTPQLCSATEVEVPGGYEFHGCLAARVPPTWDKVSDDENEFFENFRVRIRSLRGPVGSQQTELLDFTTKVVQAPSYTADSEAATIRSGDEVTYEVSAQSQPQAFSKMKWSVDNTTLPTGFRYKCTEEAKAADPPTCLDFTAAQDERFFNSVGTALGDFTLVSPERQLGSSRIVQRMKLSPDDGEAEEEISWHDAITNLATQYGLQMDVLELREKRAEVCEAAGRDVDQCLDERGRYLVDLPEPELILPPGPGLALKFHLLIENPGLSPQTVKLSNSALDPAWIIAPSADGKNLDTTRMVCPTGDVQTGLCDPATLERCPGAKQPGVCVQPLQLGADAAVFEVTLQTSSVLEVGDEATVLIFGEVVEDPSKKAQVEVPIRIGTFSHEVEAVTPSPAFAMPQEMLELEAVVTNTGDVFDILNVTAQPPTAYADIFVTEFTGGCTQVTAAGGISGRGATCETRLLNPNETATITFTVAIPPETQPGVRLDVSLLTKSAGAGVGDPVTGQTTFEVVIHDYVWGDIDGDQLKEYAVDLNRDPSDGYEHFRDNSEGGISLVWLGPTRLGRFLDEEAREAHQVVDIETEEVTLRYFIDGNGDGRRDHLLDRDRDGLPDIYWDPHNRYYTPTAITSDVTLDGVREYFLDVNGNCQLDAWFDVTKGTDPKKGTFPALLKVHVDDDDVVDYVVDLDGDGDADAQDPVLKGRDDLCDGALGLQGIGSVILRVDMNGDGKLDTVVDADGDGDPDHFFPNGQTTSIPITLKDVTGDGYADWTYPSKGEGNPDSYYDPIEKKSGFIDTKSEFLRDLQKYAWIGVLFFLVLVLFVVLVVVTRRR